MEVFWWPQLGRMPSLPQQYEGIYCKKKLPACGAYRL